MKHDPRRGELWIKKFLHMSSVPGGNAPVGSIALIVNECLIRPNEAYLIHAVDVISQGQRIKFGRNWFVTVYARYGNAEIW